MTYDFSSLSRSGLDVREGVTLAPLTTMKVGGPADYFVTVTDEEQLTIAVRWCHGARLPYFVLGGGSNILISDRGVRGLVIYNRSRRVAIEVQDATRALLTAASGAAMAGVARTSIRHSLTGLEWAVSVPGTVGGAVVGNAGAHGGEIKDNLRRAAVLDEKSETIVMMSADFAYAYRDSSLKRKRPLQAGFKPVVLWAEFALASGDEEEARARAGTYLAHRRRTQPVEPSLGSTFVNPPGDFAGRLIEAAGLKGERAGGVEVSSVHANFIINPGGAGSAAAADVLKLVRRIQEQVARQSGILLETEIQLAGDWD
ncbi:MAG: UDP-N-acetylmuramate dehydrogenase [Caldilineaceae bacterium]|nr:UDP-N-acetylmuramate dehydrogenase [Caldilineaceae bacterium]